MSTIARWCLLPKARIVVRAMSKTVHCAKNIGAGELGRTSPLGVSRLSGWNRPERRRRSVDRHGMTGATVISGR
jgi:hypothetical protein